MPRSQQSQGPRHNSNDKRTKRQPMTKARTKAKAWWHTMTKAKRMKPDLKPMNITSKWHGNHKHTHEDKSWPSSTNQKNEHSGLHLQRQNQIQLTLCSVIKHLNLSFIPKRNQEHVDPNPYHAAPATIEIESDRHTKHQETNLRGHKSHLIVCPQLPRQF